MKATTRKSAPSSLIENQAADWLMRKHAGLSPAESGQLQAWLDAEHGHAVAYARMESTWTLLNQPRVAGLAPQLGRTLADRQHARRWRRKMVTCASLGLAAAAALIFAVLPTRTGQDIPFLPSTVTARPDRQVLPDGSVVELNMSAEVAVTFTADQRRVTLIRGEALFQVTKDVTRPFIVTAGEVQVRAVGTVFTVNHERQRVDVVVTEGRVAVERPAIDSQQDPTANGLQVPTYLKVGDRLSVPVDSAIRAPVSVETLGPEQLASALAWRGRRVEFTATAVAEAVELFNRQNRLQLAISDRTVANLELSGIFWADDPEGFVRLLESGMNVRAVRSGNTVVLSSR